MGRYGNYPNPELCAKYGCFALKNPLGMGCDGCNQQQQVINSQRASALKNAIAYAKEKQVPVSLYQDPATREFLFVEARHANGLPVLQTISPYFEYPA
jgi:hypothetical protein